MKRAGASCGLTFSCPADLQAAVAVATQAGYDFLALPIVHPRYRLPEVFSAASKLPGESESIEDSKCRRGVAFTRSDLLLTSADWSSLIVGLLSRHLNLESENAAVRRGAEETLKRELSFASHLGLPAIMVPLTKLNNANLARNIYGYMLKVGHSHGQVWLKVPMYNVEGGDEDDTWNWWDQFRSCADTDKKLNLALVVGREEMDEKRLQRWLGEPVRCLVLPTSIFLANKRGFPVLPRVVQATLRPFIGQRVQFLIEGRNMGHDVRFHQQYLDHLVQTQEASVVDPVKQYAQGYEDYLQSPLQPLMDNLESGTYEVFEKDPVKYSEYQRAIHMALLDRVTDEEAKTKTIVVMVLGAGRGPLVRASLKAAEMGGRKVKVYAVEKNTNAVVTLLTQKEEQWGDQVDVISGDMRDWKNNQELADIVVSELLGSFGDNELSPECLYDAQHLFRPDAISIPCSYTSFVGPLQSAKLYHEVRNSFDPDKNPHAHYETPYVVHLQNRTELAPPQPLFTFVHPLRGQIDNTRYEKLTFDIDMDSELHGFGGYFECTLYKDVMISINPATHSKGMFSWFPIFFPLKAPVKLFKGNEVELHFWRLNNSKQVWYEWCVTKPVPVPIHNPNGRSYTIGL